MDLTGIQNENEFYTTYYLQEVLSKDLSDRLDDLEWERAPEDVLRSHRADYHAVANQLVSMREHTRRLATQREVMGAILSGLGYDVAPRLKELHDEGFIPLLGEVKRPDGTPHLCIVEAPPLPDDEAGDPLEQTLRATQYEGLVLEYAAGANVARSAREAEEGQRLRTPLAELITRGLFALEEPPRWVLVVSFRQLVLLDRTKWDQKRLLRFELDEIYGRNDTATLRATAGLLHRRSTCPPEGLSLLDSLDENAHKHAFAVSEDLKYALREAIELLGNEAIRYLTGVRKEKIYDASLDPDQLSNECLRFMYRLLFLFYIEARPELGFAPMGSDTYLGGYSLESLRDLELVELKTEEARNGSFLHRSLQRLFDLVYNGYPSVEGAFQGDGHVGREPKLDLYGEGDKNMDEGEGVPEHHTFQIAPLRSHLFDPERTPTLNKVTFRNETLRRVVELMSLSREGQRGSKRRGRISYAQLGINQLGAVYEALLSYSGFFAEEDLYEVKKAGEKRDELAAAYFVPESDLDQFSEDEIVLDDDGNPLKYRRGSFIYRLAGREREKSASYYTPEVLTRSLVKYALKELLEDKAPDEILQLSVCEPAMGSGAFLNEAINQLAEAYLQRKQEETGDYISHEAYAREKQKVKMFIADNNVFGVDLNPIATELAEVSLWLNTIYEQKADDPERQGASMAFVPWFGMQLETGNSLIGARRQVFAEALVQDDGGRGRPGWMETAPDRVEPGTERPTDGIYHFLLPDYEMANYSKSGGPGELAGDEIDAIRSWRRDLKKGFEAADVELLKDLSAEVDKLWEKHTRQQRRLRKATTDPIQIWGQPKPEKMRPPTTTRWKDDRLHQELYSEGQRMSSAYRRLKLVMDYWCALWFWPIDAHEKLPTRDEWLMDLQMILQGDVYQTTKVGKQQLLFPDTMTEEARQLTLELKEEHGFVDVEALCDKRPRLKRVRELSERYRFFHWELEFADHFNEHGGFDLILGNPPWLQVNWDERRYLSDYEPVIDIRDYTATRVSEARKNLIEKYGIRGGYLAEYEEADSMQSFFSAVQNYPQLGGSRTNLYKCFLPVSWYVSRDDGVAAFITQDGLYSEKNAGGLRRECYPRLKNCFFFRNEKRLFDVSHTREFILNVFSNRNMENVEFDTVVNLFHPYTIDECYSADQGGEIPGIKDENGNWNLVGHPSRVVHIDDATLDLFARLYDEEGTPRLEVRLPVVHSREIVEVLHTFGRQSRRLGSLGNKYYSTQHWNETIAQNDGTIEKSGQFATDAAEWIVSGPHIFVGCPLYQTPREEYSSNAYYDSLDLTDIPRSYLPRSIYKPRCARSTYAARGPIVQWEGDEGVNADAFFRLGFRKMMDTSMVRSLIPAILPRGVAHIDGVFSIIFRHESYLPHMAGLVASLPYDFFIKATGKSNFRDELAAQLPFPVSFAEEVSLRALALNCLTDHYAELWAECWQETFRNDSWAKEDVRLQAGYFAKLSPEWTWETPLRSDFARRQALVELDVLAAQALGLTLDQLQTIYRAQFPVLRKYEDNTWYDINGRIIYTKNRGLPGVGLSSKEFDNVREMQSGTVEQTIEDDTQPGGPVERTIVYEAPFAQYDREADYAEAWAHFEERLGSSTEAASPTDKHASTEDEEYVASEGLG